MSDRYTISVIIPVYNGEKTVAKTIAAILAQDYPLMPEVIVVDDGSTDRTKDIVQQFPRIKYFYRQNAGPAAARNYGAGQAGSDIVFFVDADCIPRRDWIAKMMALINEPDVAAVMGSYGIANPENLLAGCIHGEIIFRHKKFLRKYTEVFGSYNVAIKKIVFDQVGKFDCRYRDASGEDNDLSYRILKAGYRIRFQPEGLVDHFHPVSLRKYLRTQFAHGFWRARLYRQHPQMMKGDGYTFWKDIVEPALVLALLADAHLVLVNPLLSAGIAGIVAGSFIVLEVTFGLIIARFFRAGLFLALVMFLRSFARTFGFIAGALIYSKNILR